MAMVHVETQAHNWLQIIACYEDNLQLLANLQDEFSKRFGNIDNEIINYKVRLEDNLAKYTAAREASMCSTSQSEQEIYKDQSRVLRQTIERLQRFWNAEVLPLIEQYTQNLEESIEPQERTEERKGCIQRIKESFGIVKKVLDSGKKTWEMISEYKDLFVLMGSFVKDQIVGN